MNRPSSWPTALGLLFVAGCASLPTGLGPVRPGTLADGIYRGSARQSIVKETVEVTVHGGRVTDVAVVGGFASWIGRRAERVVPQRIVERQSTDVDGVTGATASSRAIMLATQRALEQAASRRPAP